MRSSVDARLLSFRFKLARKNYPEPSFASIAAKCEGKLEDWNLRISTPHTRLQLNRHLQVGIAFLIFCETMKINLFPRGNFLSLTKLISRRLVPPYLWLCLIWVENVEEITSGKKQVMKRSAALNINTSLRKPSRFRFSSRKDSYCTHYSWRHCSILSFIGA